MNVGAAVARSLEVEPPIQIPGAGGAGVNRLALPAAAVGDTVGILLQELASPQISSLIGGIGKDVGASDSEAVAALMRGAVSAVAEHDFARALSKITEVLIRAPERWEAIHQEPGFAPSRSEVESLLQHHAAVAKTDAEQRLSVASQLWEAAGERVGRGINVPQVLSIAHQLLTTDVHANVLVSGDLSQSVINYYGAIAVAPADAPLIGLKQRRIEPQGKSAPGAFGVLYGETLQLILKVSERVPAKLLMIAWLLMGLMSGLLTMILRSLAVEVFSAALPLEIWGAGSVGLIGFGTYRRLRKASGVG